MANIDIKDMQGLDRYVEMNLKEALRQVAKETAHFLYKLVKAEIYSIPESEWYDRTYMFLSSITKSKVQKRGNEFLIEVYFDEDKIRPVRTENGGFNAHMSLNGDTSYEGRSISSWLIEWMEFGYNDRFRGEQSPHLFIEKSREWLDDEIGLILNRAFAKAGFQLSVDKR